MTRTAWWTRGLLLAAVFLGGANATSGCSAQQPGLSDGAEAGPHGGAVCGTGVEGCACPIEGATAACGRVVKESGDYVTCSEGFSHCDERKWTECIGNTLVVRSIAGVALSGGGAGIHPLDLTTCSNLCDPNCGGDMQSGPGSVTGSGFSTMDGGLSLATGEGGGGSGCMGLGCDVASCGGSPGSTTITGTVLDPASKNPLYNVTVYIPDTVNGALPAFTSGVSKDQCSGSTANVVTSTTTAADGTFTLTGVPSTVPNIPIVVQTGKWRRELILNAVTSCTANTVSTTSCNAGTPAGDCVLRLPGSSTDGWNWTTSTWGYADMPKIAVSTGSADPLECLLLEVGVNLSEFGSPGNNTAGHVQMYYDPFSEGTLLDPNLGGSTFYAGDTLWDSPTNLALYDVVLLPCNGHGNDKFESGQMAGHTSYDNIINYTDLGGRAFMTHYSYVWLEYPWATWPLHASPYVGGTDNWSTVATWLPDTLPVLGRFGLGNGSTIDTQDPLPATIETGFAKGTAFSSWLNTVGASPSSGEVYLHQARQDLTAIGPNSQDWMIATDDSSGVPTSEQTYNPHFTFNTPYLASSSAQYGRVVYSDFHASATALNSCASEGSSGGTCTTNSCSTASQCASGHCLGSGSCECTNNDQCASGTCNLATGACACGSNSQCASDSCTGETCSCTTGAQCNSGTCGTGMHAGHCKCTTSADCPSGSTCMGGGPNKYCSSNTCTGAASCTVGTHVQTCGGGACSEPGCSDTTACTGGLTCTVPGGTCGCTAGSQCESGSCTAGVCGAAACSTTCGSIETCTSITSRGASQCNCLSNGDCGYGQTCSGSVIGTPGTCNEPCESTADCADSTYTCVGATPGSCGMRSCFRGGDCASGACSFGKCACTSGSQCESGTCSGGVCTAASCTGPTACGSVETCNIPTGSLGHCSKACTSSTQCTGGEVCTGGTCSGCYSVTNCTSNLDGQVASCTGGSSTPGICANQAPLSTYWNSGNLNSGGENNNGLTSSSCSTPSGGAGTCQTTFPVVCQQIPMTPQEKALEFMFFDLTGCVQTDVSTGAPTTYSPETFTQTFTSTCPPGDNVVWREIDWQASVPATASITFSGQSGATASTALPGSPLLLADATTSTALPAWSTAVIDTSNGITTVGTGPFNTAMPPVVSQAVFVLTVTMTPTTGGLATPILYGWKVQEDCVPTQ